MSKGKILLIVTAVFLVGAGLAVSHQTTSAVTPAQYGLTEGDTISAVGSNDPDIYIVNDWGFKRLFVNPRIFNLYGHLGWAKVKSVSAATRDVFVTSGLFRVSGKQPVYCMEVKSEDVATLHWVNTTGDAAIAADPDFFKKTFIINDAEYALYPQDTTYTSPTQCPNYARVPGTPTVSVAPGALSVTLASDNPAARTVTTNAQGVEFLKARFSGTGTISSITVKRTGAGSVDDFDNVYVYDGARRLVAGKTLSSTTGEATFTSLNISVSGIKDLSIVGDLSATAGNVDAFQLTGVTLSSGTVSGLPLSGNNVNVSGAGSGTLTLAKVGSLGSPNAGQANVEISEFKITANTEAASIKRIQMIQGGTVKPADFTNLKLKTAISSDVWAGTIDSAGYMVFDLGSGYAIPKGNNVVFKVFADLAGKKDETIKLYFEYSTDVLGIGDLYGYGMAADVTAVDSSSSTESHNLTLQGGVLTVTFAGPSAGDVGTNTNDTTFLLFNMAAASNIEVRKTRIDLSLDLTGDGTWEDLAAASITSGFSDFDDVKLWNVDTGGVISQADGSAFTTDDTNGNPSTNSAAQKAFTDVIDLAAGQTGHFKVTADVKTANTRTGTDIETGSKIAIGVDDYSDNTGITEIKYTGTNTALAATDISPNLNINGSAMTVRASALTLNLASSPVNQTVVKGRSNVDVLGVGFAAANASDIKITDITLTGYSYTAATGTFVKGSSGNIADMVQTVKLCEKDAGDCSSASTGLVASGPSVNNLNTTTGTVVYNNLNWVIPSGGSKTLLVRVNLSNNDKPTNFYFSFDIAATTDVTGVDSSSSTLNSGNAGVNNTTTNPIVVVTEANAGSMTLAAASSSPFKGALYWGQTGATISKFILTATDESQYLERLTIAASVSAEATDAAANVKSVKLTYTTKDGRTLTSSLGFSSGASVNFGWSGVDRPYVPKGSSMTITVAADMKTKDEGATQDSNSAVFFSLDLVDKFNGSHADGFRAVGDGSGAILDGTSSNINDVTGAYDQYVYRVYPKFDLVAIAAPYSLVGTPDVFKFTITAMGLTDSTLLFNGNNNAASGTIKFEIIASGENNTNASSSLTVYDQNGNELDVISLTDDEQQTIHASATMDFTTADLEITGGQSNTLNVKFTNPNQHYAYTSSTGRGADYFQLSLVNDHANLFKWVAPTLNSTSDVDTASTAGVTSVLKNALYGPTFQK